jgi:hypothetical protein
MKITVIIMRINIYQMNIIQVVDKRKENYYYQMINNNVMNKKHRNK